MLTEGRIPLNAEEDAAVENLRSAHGDTVTITRRDPGETGPILVHAADKTFQIAADGRVKEAK